MTNFLEEYVKRTPAAAVGAKRAQAIIAGGFEEYSAHTEEDIDETLNITEDVLKRIKENM